MLLEPFVIGRKPDRTRTSINSLDSTPLILFPCTVFHDQHGRHLAELDSSNPVLSK